MSMLINPYSVSAGVVSVTTPTTWDTAYSANGWTFANSNTTAINSSSSERTVATVYSATSGKFHVQFRLNSGSVWRMGIDSAFPGGGAQVNGLVRYNAVDGEVKQNGSVVRTGNITSSSDRVDMFFDIAAGKVWFGNATTGMYWGGNPAAGTSPAATFTGGSSVCVFLTKNSEATDVTGFFSGESIVSVNKPQSGFYLGFGAP